MVHLYFLISFRNRLVVLINWFWAWLTYAHGARVIMAQPAPYARSARGSNASAPSAQEDSDTQHLQEVGVSSNAKRT
jgi:NADH dehydrogenase